MALVSQTPVLLACAGQSTQLTVLVHWVDDPVDASILQRQQHAGLAPHTMLDASTQDKV